MNTLSGKNVGEKWLNFLQVKKYFPDFFSPDKEFIPIFFSIITIIIVFSYLFAKFIITMFFWCTLFIVFEQSIFTQNLEIRVKAKNWKK